jgi:hypothetical protein
MGKMARALENLGIDDIVSIPFCDVDTQAEAILVRGG